MTNEISDYDHNGTLVLYTNEEGVYQSLKDSVKILSISPYERVVNGKYTTVGYDIWFLKEHRKWIEQHIASDQPTKGGNS